MASAPGFAPAQRQEAAEGLRQLIALTSEIAAEGRSVLHLLFGCAPSPQARAHYPASDAVDSAHGYRWYYHSHAGRGRPVGEHGHFHLFADPGGGTSVTHLVAVSVSDRGLPLCLMAPNRWVTDEQWQPAPRVLALIRQFCMTRPRTLARVHRWLGYLLTAFASELSVLLERRDARLDALRRSAGSNVLEDRRIEVLARCPIDLAAQAAALDAARIPIPTLRRRTGP